MEQIADTPAGVPDEGSLTSSNDNTFGNEAETLITLGLAFAPDGIENVDAQVNLDLDSTIPGPVQDWEFPEDLSPTTTALSDSVVLRGSEFAPEVRRRPASVQPSRGRRLSKVGAGIPFYEQGEGNCVNIESCSSPGRSIVHNFVRGDTGPVRENNAQTGLSALDRSRTFHTDAKRAIESPDQSPTCEFSQSRSPLLASDLNASDLPSPCSCSPNNISAVTKSRSKSTRARTSRSADTSSSPDKSESPRTAKSPTRSRFSAEPSPQSESKLAIKSKPHSDIKSPRKSARKGLRSSAGDHADIEDEELVGTKSPAVHDAISTPPTEYRDERGCTSGFSTIESCQTNISTAGSIPLAFLQAKSQQSFSGLRDPLGKPYFDQQPSSPSRQNESVRSRLDILVKASAGGRRSSPKIDATSDCNQAYSWSNTDSPPKPFSRTGFACSDNSVEKEEEDELRVVGDNLDPSVFKRQVDSLSTTSDSTEEMEEEENEASVPVLVPFNELELILRLPGDDELSEELFAEDSALPSHPEDRITDHARAANSNRQRRRLLWLNSPTEPPTTQNIVDWHKDLPAELRDDFSFSSWAYRQGVIDKQGINWPRPLNRGRERLIRLRAEYRYQFNEEYNPFTDHVRMRSITHYPPYLTIEQNVGAEREPEFGNSAPNRHEANLAHLASPEDMYTGDQTAGSDSSYMESETPRTGRMGFSYTSSEQGNSNLSFASNIASVFPLGETGLFEVAQGFLDFIRDHRVTATSPSSNPLHAFFHQVLNQHSIPPPASLSPQVRAQSGDENLAPGENSPLLEGVFAVQENVSTPEIHAGFPPALGVLRSDFGQTNGVEQNSAPGRVSELVESESRMGSIVGEISAGNQIEAETSDARPDPPPPREENNLAREPASTGGTLPSFTIHSTNSNVRNRRRRCALPESYPRRASFSVHFSGPSMLPAQISSSSAHLRVTESHEADLNIRGEPLEGGDTGQERCDTQKRREDGEEEDKRDVILRDLFDNSEYVSGEEFLPAYIGNIGTMREKNLNMQYGVFQLYEKGNQTKLSETQYVQKKYSDSVDAYKRRVGDHPPEGHYGSNRSCENDAVPNNAPNDQQPSVAPSSSPPLNPREATRVDAFNLSSNPLLRGEYNNARRDSLQVTRNLQEPRTANFYPFGMSFLYNTPNSASVCNPLVPTSTPEHCISQPAKFFRFFKTHKKCFKMKADHFQLRHILSPISAKEIVFVGRSKSNLFRSCAMSYNTETHQHRVFHGSSRDDMTSLSAKYGLVVSGYYYSTIHMSDLRTGKLVLRKMIPADSNAARKAGVDLAAERFINFVELEKFAQDAEPVILICRNDASCRELTLWGQERARYGFPWAVNQLSTSPDGNNFAVMGDHQDVAIVDRRAGKEVAILKGHRHCGFSSSWHPNGYHLATANQDFTTRIWDLRSASTPGKCIEVLATTGDTARAVYFSPNGEYLAVAEGKDYVSIWDVKSQYNSCQVIDYFGKFSGMGFPPGNSNKIFIGVMDRVLGCLMEYRIPPKYCDEDIF